METAIVRAVNNDIYETLGERWYTANDDPVALLRAESRLRNPWLAARLRERRGDGASVLDVGCGAGFLSNHLAREGFEVSGIDASPESIAVATRHDESRSVRYQIGDALALPYADASFDAVCAMDFLEHVEDPGTVIRECSRILRPGGVFFFHTFNRNPLAWLVVIKGVEWFVKNTPRDMHVLRLFIRPDELRSMCREHQLDVAELTGSKPVIFAASFWRMLGTGVVPPNFRFEFSPSTLLAYTGYAERRRASDQPSAMRAVI
jgi:2-polyprenyl-6-hydroxyphenyl methylase/3-demethylubiquinone-9 3-methyltransferase